MRTIVILVMGACGAALGIGLLCVVLAVPKGPDIAWIHSEQQLRDYPKSSSILFLECPTDGVALESQRLGALEFLYVRDGSRLTPDGWKRLSAHRSIVTYKIEGTRNLNHAALATIFRTRAASVELINCYPFDVSTVLYLLKLSAIETLLVSDETAPTQTEADMIRAYNGKPILVWLGVRGFADGQPRPVLR